MEDFLLANVERTDIASFSFNLIYDLQDETDTYDENFFIRTPDGPRLMTFHVPEKTRFMQFAQRIADVRTGGRSGCDITLRIGGVVDGRASTLLEASYKPPISSSDGSSTGQHQPDSVDSGRRAGVPAVNETHIKFDLDQNGHDLTTRTTRICRKTQIWRKTMSWRMMAFEQDASNSI
jgi:hypothetical protein